MGEAESERANQTPPSAVLVNGLHSLQQAGGEHGGEALICINTPTRSVSSYNTMPEKWSWQKCSVAPYKYKI